MRARWVLVVAAQLAGIAFAVPAPAAAPGALACANLAGTFRDSFAPTYDTEEIPGSDLVVHATGTCQLNGRPVQATLDGTGRGLFAGLCGASTWSSSLDPNPPDVRPVETGSIDVTVTLTDANGVVTTLPGTWTIATENIEAVAVSTGSGAGIIATRILARCDPNAFALGLQGGKDKALFTWTQSA